ncbi:MAG: TrmH family RNA methyltransferase [Oscillospiraceae bacterium]|jgi:TrmH family RNA methyltransferase
MEQIRSRTNPLIAHLRKLGRSGAYRNSCGAFCCDGPKLLEEALLWGGVVQTVLKTEAALLPSSLPASVRVVTVPEELLAFASPLTEPQGILFACEMPESAAPERLTGTRYAVLDGLQDPGNVGAILRTAAAFSFDGVFLTGHCADLWNPKTIRATMGAVFRMAVWTASYEQVSLLLQKAKIPLYGAALGPGCVSLEKGSLEGAAIAIGSEGNGLSQALLSLCDGRVQIPMDAKCESLNAAVAAGILFWEMSRER